MKITSFTPASIHSSKIYSIPGLPLIGRSSFAKTVVNGKSLVPVISAIDSGGLHTSEVYQFAREKVAQGVIAIKGQSQANKPAIGRPTRVDINFRKANSIKKQDKIC